jgi:hypothetical protein
MKTLTIARDCLVGALVIALMILVIDKMQSCTPKPIPHAAAILKNPAAKPVKTFTDKAGDHHLEVLANSGDIPQSTLRDTAATLGNLADTAAQNMKIKTGQIIELTKENLQLKAENIQLKAKGPAADSVYYYKDKWLQLYFYLKTRQADVQYNVNITTGKFTPASWMPFVRKSPVLDFSADDPRATINNVEHLQAIIPEPAIGFTADIKGLYDVNTGTIIPAVGANLRLGRFHIADNFYYYQKARQAVTVSYDIIKINP